MNITRKQAIKRIVFILLENNTTIYNRTEVRYETIPFWIEEHLKAIGVTQQEIDEAFK